MPIRINEIASTVKVTDGESGLSDTAIARIIQTILQHIKEDQEHAQRVAEESKIRDQASEVEPY